MRRPHGLAGEVSVEILTDFPERFRPGAEVLWTLGDRTRGLLISEARPHGRGWLLRFEGVAGVDEARGLSGGELSVSEDRAASAPPGFYYSHRLRGWLCEDARGRRLGTVAGLERTAAGSMLTLAVDGREVLVPFVEGIVVRVDEERERIVLDPPEGLLEL